MRVSNAVKYLVTNENIVTKKSIFAHKNTETHKHNKKTSGDEIVVIDIKNTIMMMLWDMSALKKCGKKVIKSHENSLRTYPKGSVFHLMTTGKVLKIKKLFTTN